MKLKHGNIVYWCIWCMDGYNCVTKVYVRDMQYMAVRTTKNIDLE